MRNKYVVIYNEDFNFYEVRETTKEGEPTIYVSVDREDAMLCKEYLDAIEDYKERL